MSWISFEELQTYVAKESFNNSYYSKMNSFLENIKESNIISDVLESDYIFYPKFLWQEEKKLELYFISNDIIIICGLDEESNIYLAQRFTKNVSSIEIKNLNIDKRDIELHINFSDENVVFDSNDTNQHWKFKYYNKIKELYKLLSTY